MTKSTDPATKRYAKIAQAFSGRRGVTDGTGTKGFGASALTIDGKIFAMLSSKNDFVVKLPKDRVAALVARGDGKPFDPGHGRLMKEWLVVSPESAGIWTELAEEALAFVASKNSGK